MEITSCSLGGGAHAAGHNRFTINLHMSLVMTVRRQKAAWCTAWLYRTCTRVKSPCSVHTQTSHSRLGLL